MPHELHGPRLSPPGRSCCERREIWKHLSSLFECLSDLLRFSVYDLRQRVSAACNFPVQTQTSSASHRSAAVTSMPWHTWCKPCRPVPWWVTVDILILRSWMHIMIIIIVIHTHLNHRCYPFSQAKSFIHTLDSLFKDLFEVTSPMGWRGCCREVQVWYRGCRFGCDIDGHDPKKA